MIYLIGLLSTVAWVWLIVIAFKNDSTVWGVVMILFPPASFVFGIVRWSVSSVPFVMLLVAIGLMFTLSPEDIEKYEELEQRQYKQ